MSLVHELEVEMTNLWSLLHATAAGCISIAMWETAKELQLGITGTFIVYITASVSLLHAVHHHRRCVNKKLCAARAQGKPDVGTGNNQTTEQAAAPQGTA